MADNAIILNGKYVTESSEQEMYIQNILTKSELHLLVAELQKHVSFTLNDLTVEKVYIYDATTIETNDFGTGKNITLVFNNQVQINHLVAIKDKNQSFEKFYGRVVSQDNKKVLIYDVHKGKVNLLYSDENTGQLEKGIDKSEKHDPTFIPLSSTDEVIKQGIFDFCLYNNKLKKKYNHCGSKCGDGKTATDGGGSTINKIDGCCLAHDRCWSVFGSWDACCDKEIIDCTSRYESEDNATQNTIWWVFAASAARC